MAERDFLDKMVTTRTARNPAFPQMLDAARRRRELLRTLEGRREEQNQTQTAVAATMATSQYPNLGMSRRCLALTRGRRGPPFGSSVGFGCGARAYAAESRKRS